MRALQQLGNRNFHLVVWQAKPTLGSFQLETKQNQENKMVTSISTEAASIWNVLQNTEADVCGILFSEEGQKSTEAAHVDLEHP